jgi:hypothetical protein
MNAEFFAGELFTVLENARAASWAVSHKVKFVAKHLRSGLFDLLVI